ncbi:MAG TPA: enoyl-CoA hydratase/isomerase family protein [Steroidobacteraceae bacterium]|nr:enoyl-CoA hydratase/isomerase family protein [Steroidobacteraceae bacterium]
MIEQYDQGQIRTLKLARPPVNALDRGLIAALDAAVAAAPGEGVRGMILTGAGGRFCAGLDVQQLVVLDERGLREFLQSFVACLRRLAETPIPIVAAINGHSPAGGAVLALYCDHRVMAAGEYRIGLNEVQVGLCPGPMIHAVLVRCVGARTAAALLPAGALVEASQALELGLVDELAPLEAVEARARGWLERMLALPPQAYAATRAVVRRDLVAIMHGVGAAELDLMAQAWRSVETRTTLRALVEKLGRK